MSRIIGTSKNPPIIKFQKNDIIKNIQLGKMHFKSLEWFREYEKQTGDMTIGDIYEGMLHISNAYLQIMGSDGQITESTFITESVISTSFSNAFVFCSTNIFPNENGYVFNSDQKSVFQEFGDSALIIENIYEFIRRIRVIATQLGYTVYYGTVNYYKKNEDNIKMFLSLLNGMHNIALWKRDNYKNQQEFRIILWKSDSKADHIEFDIGDISDISKIISTKEALNLQLIKQL